MKLRQDRILDWALFLPKLFYSLSGTLKMKYLLILIITFGLFLSKPFAQPIEKHTEVDESHYNSLTDFFRKGELEIHIRSFFMSTWNKGELIDYSAIAAGGGLGYKSPHFKNFGVGMSGFFIFKLHDRNLSKSDPLTGGANRYEVALFDMQDPENGEDLDRLEELYIEFKKNKLTVIGGRQRIETPFLNSQDNRMRPNIFSGVYARYNAGYLHFEGGWIGRVTPRGTVDWYDIASSMGVYPFGRNIDGNPSQYKDNMASKGVFLIGVKLDREGWKSQFFNYTAENIFNITYADALKEIYSNELLKFDIGVQGFYQTQIGQGGNPDPAKNYIHKGERTFGIGNRLALGLNKSHWTLNTMYIHDSGRFLFPREWGREQFWASLPRERFEGNGGLFSVSAEWSQYLFDNQFNTYLGAGITNTTDPEIPKLNKNGMPDWYHLAGRATWTFHNQFEGMSLGTMLVYKGYLGDKPLPQSFVINRVDMWHYNLIIDYKF